MQTSVPCTILKAAEGSRDRPLDADIKDRGVDSTGNEVLREVSPLSTVCTVSGESCGGLERLWQYMLGSSWMTSSLLPRR
eukprot:21354-Eustigmatos_ZCMA.PRE.1